MRSLGVALLLAALSSGSARADGTTRSLFPSAEARARRDAVASAQQLERTLDAWPGVQKARVQLALPALDQAPLDRDPPVARASVWLQLSGKGPSDADITRLAQAATLHPLAVPLTIVRESASEHGAPQKWERVGPFQVMAGSAANLRATLASSLLANVALATILLWRRRRRGPRNQQN